VADPGALAHGDLDSVPARPDTVSAVATARASGVKVEDVSQRTTSERVFANPDGTWSSQTFSGDVLVHDGDPETDPGVDGTGAWHVADPTLVRDDATGGWRPKHANIDVVFSAGGDGTFARLDVSGRELGFGFGGDGTGLTTVSLPSPVVADDAIVYPDIVPDLLPGVDLVAKATETGFAHWLVLNNRPTPAQADALSFPLSLTQPDGTKSAAVLDVDQSTTGALRVVDQQGNAVLRAPAPVAWDASTTGPDEWSPAAIAAAATASTGASEGRSGKAGAALEGVVESPDPSVSAGGPSGGTSPLTVTVTNDVDLDKGSKRDVPASVVDLAARASFLTDPATVFPVTLDPPFQAGTSGDTWVQTPDYTGGQPSSAELIVGTKDAGAHVARSYIEFSNGHFAGRHILSANLILRNFSSSDCDEGTIAVDRITSSWDPATLTWGKQPTVSGAPVNGRGVGSSCPTASPATWNVTSFAQTWATGASTAHYGLRVMSTKEEWSKTYRRYRSANYSSDVNVRPHIDATYNSYPNTASAPVVANSNPGWSTTKTPTFSSTVSDPDGGAVRALFTVKSGTAGVWSGYGSTVTGSGTSTATLPASVALTEGATYTVYAHGNDTVDNSKAQSGTTTFKVDTTPPTLNVTSSAFTNGGWLNATPTSNLFTIDAGSDTAKMTVSKDGAAAVAQSFNANGDATVSWLPALGSHTFVVTATDAAGVSAKFTFAFGYGTLTMSSGAGAGTIPKTSGMVALDAMGPPGVGLSASGVHLKWRVSGSGLDASTGWTETPMPAGAVKTTAGEPIVIRGVWNTIHATTAGAAGSAGVDPRVPVLLDIEICIDYSAGTQCTWTNNVNARPQVLRVAHAFGDGFPTTGVGDGSASGQVALWTGEFETAATDVSVAGGGEDLSISRVHSTYAGPGSSPAANMFGPGWVAALDGPDAGLAGSQLVDSTLVDGTLQLVDPEGDVSVFVPAAALQTGPSKRTTASLVTGDWWPLDDTGIEAGLKLTVAGSGTSTVVTVIEDDGTSTVFKALTAPASATAGVFSPSSVAQPGMPSATSYSYGTSGTENQKVTRVLAPVPSGVSCAATGLALAAGCRALSISYAASTTATTTTPGNYAGQVTKIDLVVGAGNGTSSTSANTPTVISQATYAYDTTGRLISVTDPRNALATTYAWGTATGSTAGTPTGPRLTSIKPAGLNAVGFVYDSENRFSQATRLRDVADPAYSASTPAALSTVIYGIPVTGNAATSVGLPDMSQDAVNVWGFGGADVMPTPATGTAVFGLDHAPTGLTASSLTAADWKYGDLSYADDRGYQVYTGSYGAGQWQHTATQYDAHDQVVRHLDASDIAAIRAGTLTPAQAGTLTVYNREVSVSTATNPTGIALAEGTVVTDVYESARDVVAPDGTTVFARPHTHSRFDQGAPNAGISPATSMAYGLPTSAWTTLAPAEQLVFGDAGEIDVNPPSSEPVLAHSAIGYDNAVPTVVAGNTVVSNSAAGGDCGTVSCADFGWAQGLATTSVTYTGTNGAAAPATDVITRTAYDPQGRVIATVGAEALAAAGSTLVPAVPGTTETIYYTVGANPRASACGNKPEYADLVCQTRRPGASPTLPTTTVTGYSSSGNTLTSVDTSGGVTRTTTNTYRADEQLASTATVVTGLDGSSSQPAVTYGYSATTGLPTTTTPATGSVITTGYDSWGRSVTYTSASGETTTTAYDAAGRVKTVTDPSVSGGGTTTYAYDTAEGGSLGEERRGLLTKIMTSNPSGRAVTITGAYDAAGNLIRQDLPGNVIEEFTLDLAGQLSAQTYTIGSGDPLLSWSLARDGLGRVVSEYGPDASGAGGEAQARSYTYDGASRLATVTDQRSLTASAEACVTRSYNFDRNGNRKSLTTTPSANDGTCQTGSPTGATTTSWSHDTADRITSAGSTSGLGGAYAYDLLGRVTTLPQSDTPAARATGSSPGAVVIGYYDNDAVASITQGGQKTAYRLDADGRRTVAATGPVGGTATSTLTRHYTDASDNPGWATTDSGTGTATERYVGGISGDLALTLHSGDAAGTVQLTVTDPHGDAPAQITLPISGDAVGIDSWAAWDEYGNPIDAATTGTSPLNPDGVTSSALGGGTGYGWLGGKERGLDSSGLILMGARLYNPTTGAFTSLDPVAGGNSTAYAYPQDPINMFDLDGRWGVKSLLKKAASTAWKYKYDIALTAVSFTPGVGQAALAVRAAQVISKASKLRKASNVVKAAVKVEKTACQYNSFDGDTPVLMAGGKVKPISAVELGDRVSAADPETGVDGAGTVVDLIRHSGPHTMVRVVLADGTVLDATDGHPFWLEQRRPPLLGASWVNAVDLVPGDRLRNAAGKQIAVLRTIVTIQDLTAYNLTVEDFHTYYVGDNPVLVHNCRRPIASVRSAADKIATGADGVTRCQYCGKAVVSKAGSKASKEYDHVVPYSKGGGRGIDNIVVSCRSCNRAKASKSVGEWKGKG
jgi:large repetitive protein